MPLPNELIELLEKIVLQGTEQEFRSTPGRQRIYLTEADIQEDNKEDIRYNHWNIQWDIQRYNRGNLEETRDVRRNNLEDIQRDNQSEIPPGVQPAGQSVGNALLRSELLLMYRFKFKYRNLH